MYRSKKLKDYFESNNPRNMYHVPSHIKEIILSIPEYQFYLTDRDAFPAIRMIINTGVVKRCACGNPSIWRRGSTKSKDRMLDICYLCRPVGKSIQEQIKISRDVEMQYSGELHDKDVLIDLLKNIEPNDYTGSGKQRSFNVNNTKLFFSVLESTKELDSVISVSLVARIKHLLFSSGCCHLCGNIKEKFRTDINEFYPVCRKCMPKKQSIEYYKLFYPDDYDDRFRDDRAKRRKRTKGLHTLEWYVNKYGEAQGTIKHNTHIDRMLRGASNRTASKISLTLFNYLKENGYSDSEFAKSPKERMFRLDADYSELLKQKRIFVDFVYKNKIIEFNGLYWHKNTKQKDLLRIEFLNSLGFSVHTVCEGDYKKDRIKEIGKCIAFLEN